MNGAEQSHAVARPSRQRIGPALRELRARRGWTLADLAHRAGVSRSQVWRVEQGRSVPSYLTLARLAAALGVEVTYFTAFETTASELDRDLTAYLDRLGIPRDTWGEFRHLGIEARGALVDALRRLTGPQERSVAGQRAVEAALVTRGLPAAIPAILEGIAEVGLGPLAFTQSWMRVEELPGDRLCLVDRLSTIADAPGIDHLQTFRLLHGVEPPDPRLLTWWWTAARSALATTLQAHESRVIYPMATIERYLATGEWGMRFPFARSVVRAHAEATIAFLRRNPRYRVGLLDGSPPLGFLVKETGGALVFPLREIDPAQPPLQRIGLHFSGREAAGRLREYFDALWESIPPERRDTEAVIAWFEAALARLEAAVEREDPAPER
ncbi:MAG: helix-turn-helix transcriptional regulator [Sphaerobacter sp.]|nr:helix-turn-helix transcriptional regulator [Sphaerobacter sp.]